jgi:hypothetical protein
LVRGRFFTEGNKGKEELVRHPQEVAKDWSLGFNLSLLRYLRFPVLSRSFFDALHPGAIPATDWINQ